MDVNAFSKGAVYWYVNPNTSKTKYGLPGENQDFITDRPVIVISENRDETISLSSVECVLCTCSDRRAGFVIEMNNYDKTKTMESCIMPYTMRSIDKSYLTNYQGQISNELLEKIYQAIDYHLGRDDVVPEYEFCSGSHVEVVTKEEPLYRKKKSPDSEKEIPSTDANLWTASALKAKKEKVGVSAKTSLAYMNLRHAERLNLCNLSAKEAKDRYGFTEYIFAKLSELSKLDRLIEIKQFIQFAQSDRNRLKFLSPDQQDVLEIIKNEDILNSCKGYSEAYLNNLRKSYHS